MSARGRLGVRILIGGFAAAGVVASHAAAYLVAFPDPHARRHALEASGHTYWAAVVAVAMAVLVMTLVRFVTGRLWDPQATPERSARTLLYAFIRLTLLQTLLFTGVESSERLFTSESLSHLMQEPAFLLGLLLQVVVAFLGAILLVLVARSVRWLARRLARPAEPGAAPASFWDRAYIPSIDVLTGCGCLRGPPLAS